MKGLYKQQKQKVHQLVNAAIQKHEEGIAEEIMNDKNRSKRTWLHVNALTDKPQRTRKGYTNLQEWGKIKEDDIPMALRENWKGIYQKHKNKIPNTLE